MLKTALAAISGINRSLEKVIYLLATFIVANMVIALFLSALVRYLSGTGYDWFIELPPVLTSWLVFPLLGPLLKSGSHIKVDILNNMLTPKNLSVVTIGNRFYCSNFFCCFSRCRHRGNQPLFQAWASNGARN